MNSNFEILKNSLIKNYVSYSPLNRKEGDTAKLDLNEREKYDKINPHDGEQNTDHVNHGHGK
jgi:hypothetical protein